MCFLNNIFKYCSDVSLCMRATELNVCLYDFIVLMFVYFNQVKVAKLLLDHHCEVDPVDENGQTPLFNASRRGDVEMCQLLVRTIILMLLFIFMRYSYIGT